jgi:radical SAM superfamily enzyme
MIIGLPGETRDMILDTARYISRSGADGIKLQLLHVLENTDLAADYRAGKFQALDMEEYIALLAGCIEQLPPQICIHRLTGDGAKKELIAPLWSGDKKRVLNSIKKYFDENDIIQGKACRD